MANPIPPIATDAPSVAPTRIVDSDHPDVIAFANERTQECTTDTARSVALYYAVRDEIRYDPYGAAIEPETLCASATLERGRGWCVSKAVLLAAACRALAIPARLGFADVVNHLSTERMRENMQTDVFYWHGYTSIHLLDERGWVKAMPAYNIELCDKFGLLPLEFDGRQDSLYHAFDREGQRHMEYVNERGEFDDVPLDAILETFREHYPDSVMDSSGASFERDVEVETKT